MSRRIIPSLAAFALLPIAAVPALAGGPPSFSFEAPGAASDAVLVVHAYSCHAPTGAAVTARAEGLVDGRRRSIPLKLTRTGQPGIYEVRRQWPARGSWVLTFSVNRGGMATALVKLGPAGEPVFEAAGGGAARELSGRCLRTVYGKVAAREIEAALAARVGS